MDNRLILFNQNLQEEYNNDLMNYYNYQNYIYESYDFRDHLFIPLTEAPVLQNKQKHMPLNHNTLSKYEERRGISNLGTQRYLDQETYYRGQDAQNFARNYAARYSGYNGNNNYYY